GGERFLRPDCIDSQRAPVRQAPASVFGGHSCAIPRSPGDAKRAETARPPPVSKPVEERVRRGVTRLPWGAEQSGGRRKEYEEIQRQAGCQDVQIPCAIHFGSEH